jgi:hypothetical protein
MSGGPTQAITPKFGMGSSCHPDLEQARGQPQMSAPRGTPIVTPLKFPEGLIIGRGPANKSCSSGWVCIVKFYLRVAHLDPGPPGSTLPNGGVCCQNWAGASKQKLLLRVGLCLKNLFVGGSPQPKACWVLRFCMGQFHNEIEK